MIRTLYALGDARTRRALSLLLVLIGTGAAAQAAALVLGALFLGALFSDGPSAAGAWSMWLLAAGLVYAASNWPAEVIAQTVSSEYIRRIHELLANRAVELPLGFFDVDRSGQIGLTATSGAVFAANAPGMMLRPLCHGAASAAAACAFLLAVDWRIGAPALLFAALVLFVYRRLLVRYRASEREKTERDEQASTQVMEYARLQPVLRAAGPDSIAERSLRRAVREQLRTTRGALHTGSAVLARVNALVLLGAVLVCAVSAALLLTGRLEPGPFLGVVVLVFVLAGLVAQTMPYGEGMQMARNTLEEVQRLLAAERLPEPSAPARPADAGVEFDRVCFGYEPGVPVLREVSFRVEPGTTTAIVGPSGSGKSTLLKLAARFADVDSGAVRIGGVDVRDLGTDRVLDRLAMVFQDVYLFEDTLYENIRLGRTDASREEVLRAAELAGVVEIAERLPHGFDTVVSEGGRNLSGGQRQRVSIARALLKDAPIVLLDEATSSLDANNEHLVLQGLATLSGRRTTIVIAHRLGTIVEAEQIIVLDEQGRVEARGTHEELLETNRRYRGFWEEKNEAADWRLTDGTT
ncbi:MAG: ABC transporter ATP-binding protein [Pseudoclavibacter sp.]|nr:ABC transporter ATP-binding protein [Pseudoclavibacter sp.]